MRHRKGNKKLGRPTDQRLAMLRELVSSLFVFDKVQTTVTRAKEARRLAERLITLAKSNPEDKAEQVHVRRQVRRVINDEALVKELFDQIAPRYADRDGGYTRLTCLGPRRGDGAPLALLELLPG